MTPSFTLGKHQRLKSRKLIEQLFKEGASVSSYPLRAVYLLTPAPLVLQAGFTVSSRLFKRSVDRNRIKRLMREAYRLQKNDLEDCLKNRNLHLMLFLMYTGKEIAVYEEVFQKMKVLLQMVKQKISLPSAHDKK